MPQYFKKKNELFPKLFKYNNSVSIILVNYLETLLTLPIHKLYWTIEVINKPKHTRLWLVYWVKIGEITSDLFYVKGDEINPPTQHISLTLRTDT